MPDLRPEALGEGGVSGDTRMQMTKAVHLVLALEASHRGLTRDEVQELLGGCTRTAYRWIEAATNTGRYVWENQRLRRPRVAGSPTGADKLRERDDWGGRLPRRLSMGGRL